MVHRNGLASLLGRTRAHALETLVDPCTTSELARRVGVSPATASHHASVLRAAGLISSHRDGVKILHRLTAKGRSLLGSVPRSPAPSNEDGSDPKSDDR
jgi:DNA-binding transcriptional ArsR family regulator